MAARLSPAARGPRSDALANREKLLAAATVAVKTRGEKVPMAEIAELAGVGVGTLYRHFPTRESLLGALTHRSFESVLGRARAAAEDTASAIESIARFFEQTIEHRDELILPLHGGPAALDESTRALQRQVRETLDAVLERGRTEGSVRADVTAADIIVTGAMLAQPLPHVSGWDRLARRQAEIYVAGLGAASGPRPH